MGHIKTTELSNGNIGLEITYGGKECPFGGVDTSAPPAYIDPKCFTDCDGFIIVDEKLVAVNMAPAAVPAVLWDGTAGVSLIGFGNFYSTKYGTLNYALGYTAIDISGTPTGVQYTFYMTAWSPPNPAMYWNDTLTETLYNSIAPATSASITMALSTIGTGVAGTGATVTITAITTLSSVTPRDTGFELTGIISALTITGGIGYTPGTMYWIEQGTNVTAQVTIDTVSSGGAVETFTLVPNAYTTTYINTSNVGVEVSTAGVNYTLATASLTYSVNSNVVLEINSSVSSEYTVESNGVSLIAPTLASSGAWFAVTTIAQAGNLIGLYDFFITTPPYTDAAIVTMSILDGGIGYNTGEIYTIASGYTNPLVSSGFSFTSTNVFDPGVQITVTAVGAGGAITEFQITGTGLQTSTLQTPVVLTYYVAGAVSATPVNTVTTALSYILNTMAANINGLGVSPYTVANPDVTATVNLSSSSLVLIANSPGILGNSISVQDFSTITGPDLYYYYFPVRTLTYLTGGSDGSGTSTTLSTTLPTQASIASAGGTLYIGNIGPMIIKYGGPGVFVVSSTYQGVRVLRKFAGSLFGLGVIPAPNTVLDSTDMMTTWTTANALDVWNPVDLDGNITGAGFGQLSDIGDYLTGLIVTSATAFILRAQGISYATATGNATQPFSWSHIGLGDQGEGAQIASLVCQYDHTGFFVGNTDVYQISNTITAIGQKIKAALFSSLDTNGASTAVATSVTLGGDSFPLLSFIVGTSSQATAFTYNPSNGSWMLQRVHFNEYTNYIVTNAILGVLASLNTFAATPVPSQASTVLARQGLLSGTLSAPSFISLTEGVPNNNSIVTQPASVTFVQEEICFGRDITIDGLYVALYASVSENVTINFYVSGSFFNSFVLTPAQFNTLNGIPVEFQLTSLTGAFTVHSPQLSYVVNSITDTGTAQIRFTKFAIFGSFDPKQRPV